MKKTKIIFFSYPEYSGNSKFLYDYIVKNYNEKYEIYWFCRNEDDENTYIEKKINYIKEEDQLTKNIIETSDIIFDTHGIALKYNLNKPIYVNLWHGIGPKKAGYLLEERTMSDEDLHYSSEMFLKTDYFVTPSEFWNYIHGQLFNTNHHRMLALGNPRIENLLNNKKVEFKEFKKFNKVLLYMPTYNSNGNRIDGDVAQNILNLKKYNEKTLLKYLSENNVLLIIRYHPSEKNKVILEHNNIIYIDDSYLQKNNLNTNDLMHLSDVLLTDYSSIYLDYNFLKKPVVFTHGNIKSYSDQRGYIYENYDFWFPNNIAITYEELINLLSDKDLNDKGNLNMDLMFGKNHIKNNKNASQKIYEYFFDSDYSLKENILKNPVLKFYNEHQKALEKLEEKTNKVEVLNKELEIILNSKGWKLLEKLRKYKNIIFRRNK